MEPFYISHQEFWDWFNRDLSIKPTDEGPVLKRIKTTNNSCNNKTQRYIIMYSKHKPGKKNKVWEGDGYLTLINGIAHLSDLRGKILEEPTILDDADMETVKELGEILMGKTEIQVVEPDKTA